jgi:hypothetical protein
MILKYDHGKLKIPRSSQEVTHRLRLLVHLLLSDAESRDRARHQRGCTSSTVFAYDKPLVLRGHVYMYTSDPTNLSHSFQPGLQPRPHPHPSSSYWAVYKFFASQSLHNRIFFKKKIRRCK